MKFWQRAFFSVLLFCILCFYISSFLVSSFSYRTGLNSERQRSFGEAYFIAASLEKEITTIQENGGDISSGSYYFFRTYVSYYKNRGIYLVLSKNGAYLAGEMPAASYLQGYEVNPGEQISTVVSENEDKYMLVLSAFYCDADKFTLAYAHDLQGFTREHAALSRFLLLSGMALTILLSAGLYFLLRRLSRPVEVLDEATGRISEGDYSMRVPVQGKDELAALARHFNSMADEVETRIEELRSTAERKQQFIDNLAHELRTPLTTIRGYAEYLRNANISEDDKIISTDYIISEVHRIEEMTSKLLDLALLRHNVLEPSEISLPELLTVVSEKMRPRLLRNEIQLIVSSAPGAVYGDWVLLECMLFNLLDNAVKASDRGGVIHLSGMTENGHPVIKVQDFGSGMPREHIARLTDAFYRVDKSRSRSEGGAGLGLSLCRQIAELHRAKLVFLSEDGAGTTVKIVFTSP